MAEQPSKPRHGTVPSTDSAFFQRHPSHPVKQLRSNKPSQNLAHLPNPDVGTAIDSSASNVRVDRSSAPSDRQSSTENPDMNTTTSSFVGSKKTRTGRISKAAKGLRVHHCDECGKTYTRAEHLRRHQQNHKPGEFPCDHPNCKRSFYREDLLSRHKLRHFESFDGDQPSHPFSALPSPALQPVQVPQNFGVPIPAASYPPFTGETVVTSADLAVSAPFILQPSSPSRHYPQHVVHTMELSPPTQLHQPVGPVNHQSEYPISTGWHSAPHSQSPIAFESPLAGSVLEQSLPKGYDAGRRASTAMFLSQQTHNMSQSPVSAVTPVIRVPRHPPVSSRSLPIYPTVSDLGAATQMRSDSIVAIGEANRDGFGAQHLLPAISNVSTFQMMSAEERDLLEQVDLALLVSFSDDAEEGIYLDSYWQLIHPLYPVVHRPRFASRFANPLLKTAMLALGAHALRTKASTEKARLMHEQCIKILQKRTTNKWHTPRVCDLQAVILIEIFALFRSRRPVLQLSSWFMDAYRTLSNDMDASRSDDAPEVHAAAGGQLSETIRAALRTKQHLLLTCYLVSQTWATLFGRRRAIQSPVIGTQLPFPRKLTNFDNETQTGWASETLSAHPEKIWQVIASILNEADPRRDKLDSFQSLVLMSAIIDPDSDPHTLGVEKGKHMSFTLVRQAMEQSARCRMTWHILMLCKNTPVRALLAVAGESWVLGEKLGSAEEYAAAQLKTRSWAKGFPGSGDDYNTGETQLAIERAFHHAKQALDIHRNEPQTGLPFQEWAIYLAGLVVWARGYMSSTQARQAKALLNMREPDIQAEVQNGRFDDHELEQSMLYLAKSGGGNGNHSSSSLPWATTRCVLLWIRGRIESVDVPHSCGITNSAQDVLMKLVLRGDADGWFG